MSLLNAKGLMVELDDNDDAFSIKQYNCIIYSIAEQYPEACKYELQMYRDLFGKNTKRTGCQVDGESACVYVVPKS